MSAAESDAVTAPTPGDHAIEVDGLAKQFGSFTAGDGIQSVNVRRPTLDDVFIKYTGHDIRDAEAGAADLARRPHRARPRLRDARPRRASLRPGGLTSAQVLRRLLRRGA